MSDEKHGSLISRRRLLVLAGQGGIGLALAACAGAKIDATPTPRPVERDTLRVVMPGTATTLDPHKNRAVDSLLNSQLYDPVRRENWTSMRHEDWLTDVTIQDDGNYLLKLQEGVKFHTGDELTADDLKFTIERVTDPDLKSSLNSRFSVIERVEVVDPLTARFIFKTTPQPKMYDDLVHLQIMQRAWTEDQTKDSIVKSENGTGPWKLTKFLPDQVAEFERFDGYWGGRSGGKANFKKLEIRFVVEEASRLAALQRGDADISRALSPELLQVAEAAGLQAHRINSRGLGVMELFTKPENNPMDPTQPNPLRDKRVRLALNYMVDRDTIITKLLRGNGFPMRGISPSPDAMGYVPPEELTEFTYNPEKARQLLKDAGYPNGFKNRLTVPEGIYEKGQQIALTLADQLSEFGVETKVEVQPISIFLDNIFSPPNLAPMNLDLGFPAMLDPRRFGSSMLLSKNAKSRYSWFSDPDLEAAHDATWVTSLSEQEARIRTFNKLVWEAVPVVWLFHPGYTWVTASDLDWTPPGTRYRVDFRSAKQIR